jgi:two-component system OmpR family response regulator
MPASALSPRLNRHAAGSGPATGPGRTSAARRAGEPALTVTVAIPLTRDGLHPQAHKLIEAVRELVEISQGTVTVEPAHAGGYDPADASAGPEVRLMTGSRQVLLDGESLPLTRLEFDLLLFLAERPRRVFTRGQLLAGVWGYEHTGERTVDVHVRRLRLKLGGTSPVITTVYGVGYRLSDEARVVVATHE